MFEEHIKYLRSFGTERYKSYLKLLEDICPNNVIIPFDSDLYSFLEINNLWHTIYF